MSYTIHPMSLGELTIDTSYLVFSWKPGTKVQAPYLAYLILGGEQPIVVDTGMRVDEGVPIPSHRRIEPEHALAAQLGRHGVKPADVGLVVMTHLHIDHTGNVDRFPNARILIQRTEYDYAQNPPFFAHMYDRTDMAKLAGPLAEKLELLDGDTEIAPGIQCALVGGHSLGHQMLYVDVASGTAIITGDNVGLLEGLEQGLPTGYVVNMAQAMAVLERVKRDATHVLPGHDLKVLEKYPDGVS